MMVAQEIAGLLGETTAETKPTLTKSCTLPCWRTAADAGMRGEESGNSGVQLEAGQMPLKGRHDSRGGGAEPDRS